MNRDFKGIWIPREIWTNKKICIASKSLWAEIHSLHDREVGGCFASNEYLCEFMGMKITRLKELLKELRDEGLLQDLSCNGRQRIIRANLPDPEYGGHQIAAIAAIRQPEKRPSDSRFSGPLSYNIDISLDKRLETPPTPLAKTGAKAQGAVAPGEGAEESSKKPKKTASDFSPEVRELAKKLVAILQAKNPVYRSAPDKVAFLSQVQLLLEKDKQSPEEILRIFEFAASDNQKRGDFPGWQAAISGKNTLEVFRKNIALISSQMRSRKKSTFCRSLESPVENVFTNMRTVE